MPCHAPSGVPDLYVGRVDLDFDSRTHRQRRRVEVGQHPYAAALVDLGKMQRGQIEAFCSQRQQMLALGQHRRTDRQAAPSDDPVLFLKQTGLQKPVQSLQIMHLRYGDKMVAPELAALALHATLLVAFTRRAELRPKAPVRTEGNEPRGLFPLMAT